MNQRSNWNYSKQQERDKYELRKETKATKKGDKMIGLLAPLIGGTVKTLCMSMLSEKLLKQVILILLERLVKSTDNTLDDQILAEYKKHM